MLDLLAAKRQSVNRFFFHAMVYGKRLPTTQERVRRNSAAVVVSAEDRIETLDEIWMRDWSTKTSTLSTLIKWLSDIARSVIGLPIQVY